jgi:glycosyltransferase involved in cell wall biosynthesis
MKDVMQDLSPSTAGPSADRPLVTHFVYGYRQERTIRAAIDSVLAQTYAPLEIVLSDDCSPDGTFGVMQEAAAAYRGPHRIVLNRNPVNLGIARHVERIMELASGDFVIESGGDDISLPHRDARLVEAWLASGRRAHLVHSAKRTVDARGNPLDMPPGREPPLDADATPLAMLQHKYALIGATSGWSRAIYDRFGPISDLAAFHDYPIGFRALLLGEVRYLDEPLVVYSKGGVSTAQAQPCGYRYFFGDRIRYMRWDLEFHRNYRRDMERVPPVDIAACRAACDGWIREADLTIGLADAGPFGRLAHLPRAAALSLRHREPALLRTAAKYLFAEPMMRRLDRKTADGTGHGAGPMPVPLC